LALVIDESGCDGLEALEARLARGEITREEFEQARRALGA